MHKAYDTPIDQINLTSSVFLLTMTIFAYPSIYIIKQIGIKVSIKLAMFMFFIGTLMRVLIGESIYLVIFGQFLCGFASAFIGNLQVRVISEWFNEKEVSFCLNKF